jgi:CubicO group peptidase (beta-lactamase class C family)
MAALARVAELITRAIEQRVTPAAVVEAGTASGVRWRAAFGRLTYAADAPPCSEQTVFDLASLTKVIATASIAMRLVERGVIRLETPIRAIEPRWHGAGRDAITLQQLMEHASGLPAHVPLYQVANDRESLLDRILTTPLDRSPGSAAVYSDLGFILLGFLLERAAAADLRTQFAPLAAALGTIGFTPPASWIPTIAPTEVDPWRGRLIQGSVHDENAFVLGGVAGHAGLFGTAEAVGRFARLVLQTFRADSALAQRDTMRRFATRSSVPHSSRALGWDTMLPTSSCGSRMSEQAIGHTGFTGTSIWIDPEQDLYVVLLTNRVHPSRTGEGIQPLRRAVADAVVESLTR